MDVQEKKTSKTKKRFLSVSEIFDVTNWKINNLKKYNNESLMYV